MKISQKLIIGYLGVALLVVIFGIVSTISTQKIYKSYNRVIYDTVPEIEGLEKMRTFAFRMMMETVSCIVLDEAGEIDEEAAEFLKAKEEIEASKAVNTKRIEPDDALELQFVREIDIAVERIGILGAEIIALKKKGASIKRMLETKEELEEAEESFLSLIDRTVRHEIGEFEEDHEMVIQNIATSRNIIIFVSLGIFLFAIGLGYRISQSISRPLKELEKISVEIGQGNLDARTDLQSRDELGDLADHINRMAADLKTSFEERDQSRRDLEETTMQLVQSEKLAALGELTAGVAHEMNQPLNGIKIISQSLLKDIRKKQLDEEDLDSDLTEIVDQVNKMAEIVDHMRFYTRQSEGGSNENIQLNTLVEGPFRLLDQQLKTHNIQVAKKLDPKLPEVEGDFIRLEQVFMNLITNARHALDNSGREDKRIEVETYEINAGKNVVAEFRDNGVGIPEDSREKIFQAFFTTKEPGKGTGLGLSVSNRIIEEHNGKIEFESTVGEGTSFRVILPT